MSWIYRKETDYYHIHINLSNVTYFEKKEEMQMNVNTYSIKFYFIDGSTKSISFKTKEELEDFYNKLTKKLN